MAASAPRHPHQLMFRPFRLWLWLHIAALLLLNCGALVLAVVLRDARWLLATLPATLLIFLLICRYRAEAIIINGASLICRHGLLRVREITIPIIRLNFEIRQTFTGRLFDYGTVRIMTSTGIIEIQWIESIEALQTLIAERQTEVYMAPRSWHLIDHR